MINFMSNGDKTQLNISDYSIHILFPSFNRLLAIAQLSIMV